MRVFPYSLFGHFEIHLIVWTLVSLHMHRQSLCYVGVVGERGASFLFIDATCICALVFLCSLFFCVYNSSTHGRVFFSILTEYCWETIYPFVYLQFFVW